MKTRSTICSMFAANSRALNAPSPIHSILAPVLLVLTGVHVFAASTINFAIPSGGFKIVEDAGAITFTVLRTNDTDTTVSVDYFSSNLLATAGLDYTEVSGTLVFAPGETNHTIVVPILNDGLVETPETFRVTLSNPTNATVGPYPLATVYITDNDTSLQFEFGLLTFSSYQVNEGEGYILIGVARGDDGDFPVSVDFASSNGSALVGQDYTATNGTLDFASGQKVALFTVPIFNDGMKENSETFRVTLSNPTNQVLGSQRIATVTIVDNDFGVQFQPFNQYWIAENEGAMTLTVVRGNDVNLDPITVDFATSDVTTTAGVDYLATNGTLSFAQGEMQKTITVPVLFDESPEADEKFKVTLSNPTGGGVLAMYSTATITLMDTTGMKAHRFEAVLPLPDGSVQFTLGGGTHQRFKDYYDLYPIEVSSNLVDWTPLVTLQRTNASTNTFTFTDMDTKSHATRFYRTPATNVITPWLKPGGAYPVGALHCFIADPSRRNRYSVSTNNAIPILVLYPAAPVAGQLPDAGDDPRLFTDPFMYADIGDRTHYFVAHWLLNAPCATHPATFPVVFYSPGGGGTEWLPADLGPNLASHGYVVVSMAHWEAVQTVLPDGRYMSRSRPSSPLAAVLDRVRDLAVVLDELARWNTNHAVLAGRLDLANVGAIGGSMGGRTALEWAAIDDRCKAVVALDGLDSTTEITLGLARYLPRQALMRINAPDIYDQTVYSLATHDAVWFQISGADHHYVAANDWYWKDHPTNLPFGIECERTLIGYSLWFFDKYLKHLPVEPLPLAGYPLVTNLVWK